MSCKHDYNLGRVDKRGEGRANIFPVGIFYCRHCLDVKRVRLD